MGGNENSGRLAQGTNLDITEPDITITCPDKFKGDCRKYWNKTFTILSNRGSISDGDFFAFERLCVLYGEWCRAEKVVLKEGMTYSAKTDRGSEVRRITPEGDIMMKLNKEIKDLEHRFGLTPLDREGVKQNQPKGSSTRGKYDD